MEYLIVFFAICLFWLLAWAFHQILFVNYRRMVARECGASEHSWFTIVPDEARPQQIYDGVVRVGEKWLCSHGVPASSLPQRR